MKVSDMLRIKGPLQLYSVEPTTLMQKALLLMAEHDLGSLIVMEGAQLRGLLTFREVIQAINHNQGSLGSLQVGQAMDDKPLTCSPETALDEVRRMMLESHARYMPVLHHGKLEGIVSFYDVAKAVVDSQNFENKMLKAYIRDWPTDDASMQS